MEKINKEDAELLLIEHTYEHQVFHVDVPEMTEEKAKEVMQQIADNLKEIRQSAK